MNSVLLALGPAVPLVLRGSNVVPTMQCQKQAFPDLLCSTLKQGRKTARQEKFLSVKEG